MSIHFTTFVVPADVAEEHVTTPVIVLSPNEDSTASELPPITALHLVQRGYVSAFARDIALAKLAIGDDWLLAARAYGDSQNSKARVVLALERLPRTADGHDTAHPDDDMPIWALDLLNRDRYRCAMRDIPVTAGPIAELPVLPIPETIQDWADVMVE